MAEPLCTVFINRKAGKVLIVDLKGGTVVVPLEEWMKLYEHAVNG